PDKRHPAGYLSRHGTVPAPALRTAYPGTHAFRHGIQSAALRISAPRQGSRSSDDERPTHARNTGPAVVGTLPHGPTRIRRHPLTRPPTDNDDRNAPSASVPTKIAGRPHRAGALNTVYGTEVYCTFQAFLKLSLS